MELPTCLEVASVPMDTPKITDPSDCALCNDLGVVTIVRHCYYHLPSVQKHDLFHGGCERCDDPAVRVPTGYCKPCQHLRLEHLMLCWPLEQVDMRLWIHRREKATTTCGLCDLFAFNFDDSIHQTVRLLFERELSSQRVFLNGKFGPDRGLTTFDHSQHSITRYVDWEWAKSWLDDLREDLPDPVRFPRLTLTSELGFDFMNHRTESVLVVDVFQKCVVPLPCGATYAALSYVWGLNATQFQTSVTNVRDLEQLGSLDLIRLPSTICDAMLVCKELDQRYLWVDRLCIIQDGSWDYKSVQLDQMAIIYGQADFTIVAAEGDNLDFGLVGVSRSRKPSNKVQLNKNISLVEVAPSLSDVLRRSTWVQRAWTFQEYLSSSKLLFFTKTGLFFRKRQLDSIRKEVVVIEEFAEVATPSSCNPAPGGDLRLTDVLTIYTGKSLTHSTDILRAIAGILNATHGKKISHGMPWINFDLFILWFSRSDKIRISPGSDVFPTWSWVSVHGQAFFPNAAVEFYSLAFWGMNAVDHSNAHRRPSWEPFAAPLTSSTTDLTDLSVVAVAWLSGCLLSKVPEWVLPGCSEYNNLEQQSNTMERYHDAAFGSYSRYINFDGIDIGLDTGVGKIAVHTQIAKFILGGQYQSLSGGEVFLRACANNRIAGAVKLDRQPPGKDTVVTLIALSVGTQFIGNPIRMIRDRESDTRDDFTINKFYGCTCWLEQADHISHLHLPECPNHTDFWTPSLPRDMVLDTVQSKTERLTLWNQAFNRHLLEVRDLSEYSHLIVPGPEPPKLNVMLVTPSAAQGGTTTIYERLGIGQVYLKRWLEANPKFETIVLA